MAYELTEEQIMLKDTVARIAKEQIAPGAEKRDVEAKFPWDMVDILRENALFGTDFPEEYGGSQMGLLALCLIVEEIAKVCASTSVILPVHELGVMPILLAGNEEQKTTYLPKLATGEHLIAFGLTEANAGSDVAGVKTKAVQDGDHYLINGTKIFISHADVAEVLCIAARTDTSVPGHKGTSMFIVEKGMAGFSSNKLEKMGNHASDTAELFFDDCRVPAANLLGPEGSGFKTMMKNLQKERLINAVMSMAACDMMIEDTIKYARERTAFGRPISGFQVNKHKIVEMASETEMCKIFLHHTIQEYVAGNEMTKEVSMVKYLAAELANRVAYQCVQLHGGIGMTWEYPAHLYLKRAKSDQLAFGSAYRHRSRLAELVDLPLT